MYVPVEIDIGITETRVVVNTKLVIKVSPGKIEIEVWLIEIKDTVVVCIIDVVRWIVDTECAVSECRV